MSGAGYAGGARRNSTQATTLGAPDVSVSLVVAHFIYYFLQAVTDPKTIASAGKRRAVIDAYRSSGCQRLFTFVPAGLA